jgi:prepilin peptidase CpaA
MTRMLPLPIRVTLTLVVVIAAVTDLKSRRIPNWLTLPAVPIGLVAQTIYGEGFLASFYGACAGFVALLALFAIGAGGAGDVKLFTVVGSFVGIHNLLVVFVLVALLGGVAAVIVALRAGALGNVLRNIAAILMSAGRGRWREFQQRSDLNRPGALSLPYGAVIAAGVLLFTWFPRGGN